MKSLHIIIIFALVLGITVSCSTSKKTTSSTTTTTTTTTTEPKKGAITQEDADYISKKMSITTVAELTEGSTIYTAECGVCHGLKKPSARSEDEWKAIVPPMVAKANAKAGKDIITPRQQDLIIRYLLAFCNK